MVSPLYQPNVLSDPNAPPVLDPNYVSPVGGSVARGLRSALYSRDAASAAWQSQQDAARGDVAAAEEARQRALEASQAAQQNAPRVQTLRQAQNLGDVGSYVAGQLGAAPVALGEPLVKGAIGGLLGRRFGRLGAEVGSMGGAAQGMYGPGTEGAALQQTEAEAAGAPKLAPEEAMRSERMQGAATALPMAVVPGLAARSVVGAGTRTATLGQRVVRDTTLNAGLGAGAEAIGQQFETSRNPGRDTSEDSGRLVDSATSNALLGAAMAPLGHAGDVAHGAVASGSELGGKAAGLVWDGSKFVARKAAESAPHSVDEAAIALGKGAAKAHDAFDDAINKITARNDPDIKALLTPQTDMTPEALMADDAIKHTAADKLTQQVLASADKVPGSVRAAAEEYQAGPKTMDSWSKFAGTLGEWKRSEVVSDATDSFAEMVGKAGVKVRNFGEDVKAVYDSERSKKNAQRPEADEFDGLLANTLFPHTGLTDPDMIMHKMPDITFAMRKWIETGFGTGGDATKEPLVPSSLHKMFDDPVVVVRKATQLMIKEGYADESIARPLELKVISELQNQREAGKSAGLLIDEYLKPTVQDKHQFSGADHEELAQGIQDQIRRGKVNTERLGEMFRDPERLLEALHRQMPEYKKREHDVDGGRTSASLDSDEHMGEGTSDAMKPNEVTPEVQWHHYNENTQAPYEAGAKLVGREGTHDSHAQEKMGTLGTINNSDVRKQGYVDYLREKHSGSPEQTDKIVDFIQKHAHELSGDERAAPDKALNKKYFVLREENGSDAHEAIDIPSKELAVVTPRARGNVWAKSVGKKNEYAGPEHGTLWFERADGTKFATSAERIIKRMNGQIGKDRENAAHSQISRLSAGISSLLNSHDATGAMALKGHVGVMENGRLKWLKSTARTATKTGKSFERVEGLPDNLAFHKTTLGDLRSEAGIKYSYKARKAGESFDKAELPDMTLAELRAAYTERKATLEKTADKGAREGIKKHIELIEDEAAKRTSEDDVGGEDTKNASTYKAEPRQKEVGSFPERNPAVERGTEQAGTPAKDTRSRYATPRDKLDERLKSLPATEFVDERGTRLERDIPKGVRTADEGNELDNRGVKGLSHPDTAGDAKQTGFLLDKLSKGMPAFNAMLKTVTSEQAGKMHETLTKMLEAKSPDAPIWHGQPPKDMEAFGNRARLALKAMDKEAAYDAARAVEDEQMKGRMSDKELAHMEADKAAEKAEARTVKKNAMAADIHRELGREGIPATHDSPIKHEGKFNWRAHQGKGEGAAAFGAGTYLSTANGVHKMYKNQFSAMTQGARFLHDLSGDQNVREWLQDQHTILRNDNVTDPEEIKQSIVYGLREEMREYDEGSFEKEAFASAYFRAKETVASDFALGKGGAAPTYHVTVDAKPEELLKWDAPLHASGKAIQKAVEKDAIEAFEQKAESRATDTDTVNTGGGEVRVYRGKIVGVQPIGEARLMMKSEPSFHAALVERALNDMTGQELYDHLVHKFSDRSLGQQIASDYLQSLGIVGHEYASEGGDNAKFPNYVIYDDSRIKTNYVELNRQKPTLENTKRATPEEVAKANAHIDKVLGPQMKREFVDSLGGHSADWTPDAQGNVIRIATNAFGGVETNAHHESMHEFFHRLSTGGQKDVATLLTRVANNAIVFNSLRRILADHPEALAAMKADPEERLAYAYQFWEAGHPGLKLGPQATTFFEKVAKFLRHVTGLLRDDEKAEALFRQFSEGKLQDPSAAGEVLAKLNNSERRVQAVAKVMEPFRRNAIDLVGSAEDNLLKHRDAVVQAIGSDFTDHNNGFIQAADRSEKQWLGKLKQTLALHDPEDVQAALEGLQTRKFSADAKVREVQKGVDKLLQEIHPWLRDAGVSLMNEKTGQWEPIAKRNDYFPRSWDLEKLHTNGAEFISKLLEHHMAELTDMAKNHDMTPEQAADSIYNSLLMSNGQGDPALKENSFSLGYSPYMKAINKRTLDWIDMKHFHEFQNKDLVNIMSSYIMQATKRAEYTRRFGSDGGKLQTRVDQATKNETKRLMSEDPKLTHDDAQIKALKNLAPVRRAIMAMEGTLGHDISPTLRKAQGWVLAYQNWRMLPMALFSNLIDPLGIMVRGGTMNDTFGAYKNALQDVVNSWRGKDRDDNLTQMGEAIGTLDAHGYMSSMGTMMNSVYMAGGARKMNDALFKANGMEALNRSLRGSATQAAIGFIKRHATQPNGHSERLLKEVNLDAKYVKSHLTKEGGLDVTDARIQNAVAQWVNEAILRPTSAQRPSRLSDPHWALIGHFKGFMYSMHKQILTRAAREARLGNYTAASTLALGYIPVMYAADMAKLVIQNAVAGNAKLPAWWEAMDAKDHAIYAAERAGLAGPSQVLRDTFEYGPAAAIGPTGEQLTSLFTQPLGKSAMDALPWSQFFASAQRAVND